MQTLKAILFIVALSVFAAFLMSDWIVDRAGIIETKTTQTGGR